MSGYKADGDDLLIFQTPAEALAKHKTMIQTPQSTGGTSSMNKFFQPQYPFQNGSSINSLGSMSPSGSESSFSVSQPQNYTHRLSPQSTTNSIPASATGGHMAHHHEHMSMHSQMSGSMAAAPVANKVLSQRDRLRQFFDICDFNKDGRLSEDELCHALRNYDQTEFKKSASRTMIKLFDKDQLNSVDFEDFVNVWNYLSRWRTVFEKCDLDNDSSINHAEFSNALKTFGFDLPLDSINHIFFTFSTIGYSHQPAMKFDSFIESMVWIMKVTEVFKKYPSVENGATAQVGYFDFIDVLLAFKD